MKPSLFKWKDEREAFKWLCNEFKNFGMPRGLLKNKKDDGMRTCEECGKDDGMRTCEECGKVALRVIPTMPKNWTPQTPIAWICEKCAMKKKES